MCALRHCVVMCYVLHVARRCMQNDNSSECSNVFVKCVKGGGISSGFQSLIHCWPAKVSKAWLLAKLDCAQRTGFRIRLGLPCNNITYSQHSCQSPVNQNCAVHVRERDTAAIRSSILRFQKKRVALFNLTCTHASVLPVSLDFLLFLRLMTPTVV